LPGRRPGHGAAAPKTRERYVLAWPAAKDAKDWEMVNMRMYPTPSAPASRFRRMRSCILPEES
jgi:hypothetical protein